MRKGRLLLRTSARDSAVRNRMVVVPLLEQEVARHALELACRLAADRGAHVLLLAPLLVEWELPLDAHFQAEELALRDALSRERALAEGYGVGVQIRIVRARPGQVGRAIAATVEKVGATLVVVGAAIPSRSRVRNSFSRDVWTVIRDAPCPVMIAALPNEKTRTAV